MCMPELASVEMRSPVSLEQDAGNLVKLESYL